MKSGDLQDSTYVVEMREILEPEFTALAATRIEDQHLAMMREAVAVMDRSMKNPDAYIEADLDFHLALAEAAGNPLILSLLDSLVGVLREQRLGIFAVTVADRSAVRPITNEFLKQSSSGVPAEPAKQCVLTWNRSVKIQLHLQPWATDPARDIRIKAKGIIEWRTSALSVSE